MCFKEVDPCEDLSDDDIRIAIENSMGPRNKLFVPEVKKILTKFLFELHLLYNRYQSVFSDDEFQVPFEVLIRRQIERLLYPSLQCLQFACSELVKV